MLILTRRIGESLKINDDITVTILDVRGSQTSVGITAPDKIPVHREEVYNRIIEDAKKQGKDVDLLGGMK